jgi:hypothetical protein
MGIQLNRLGIPIWCDSGVQVHFDNIHERPSLSDLLFFFYRWKEQRIDTAHALFHTRWGYWFYNEHFMKNWAFRRKVFSVCRFVGLPSRASDLASRAANRLLRAPVPAKFSGDPLPVSHRVLKVAESGQLSS